MSLLPPRGTTTQVVWWRNCCRAGTRSSRRIVKDYFMICDPLLNPGDPRTADPTEQDRKGTTMGPPGEHSRKAPRHGLQERRLRRAKVAGRFRDPAGAGLFNDDLRWLAGTGRRGNGPEKGRHLGPRKSGIMRRQKKAEGHGGRLRGLSRTSAGLCFALCGACGFKQRVRGSP